MISFKRRNHAEMYGISVARNHIDDYIFNPNMFSKGIPINAIDAVGRITRAGLPLSCSWKCTEEEKDIAEKTVVKDLKRYLEFYEVHKNYFKN